MPDFSSARELESILLPKIKNATEDSQKEAKKIMKNALRKFYKSWYPTSIYNRTGQLLYSFEKGDIAGWGKGYKVDLYYDADKMDHPSNPWGKDGRKHKAEWSENKILQTVMEGADGMGSYPHGGLQSSGFYYGNPAADTTPVWIMLKSDMSGFTGVMANQLRKNNVPVE